MSVIEMLAALLLTSVVLGVAYALFSSLEQTWSGSQNRYDVQSKVNQAVGMVSRNLSLSKAIYAFQNNGQWNEWRFKTGEGVSSNQGVGSYLCKSLVYSVESVDGRSSGVLSLYKIDCTGQYANAGSSIDYASGAYIQKTVLADNLSPTVVPTILYNAPSDISATTPVGSPIPNSPPVTGGSLLTVTLPFQAKQTKSGGAVAYVDKPSTFSVKMIKDYID